MDENSKEFGRVIKFPEGNEVTEAPERELPKPPKILQLGTGTVLKPNTSIIEDGELILMTGKNAMVIMVEG